MDPIEIEPTTSTLPVQKLAIVSGDETRGETVDGVLVAPAMPETDRPTAELLAVWAQLDDEQRWAVLGDFRTRFGGGCA